MKYSTRKVTPWKATSIVPCKGCKERRVGCHAGCEKYKSFKEQVEEEKERFNEYAKKEQLIEDYVQATVGKHYKKNNRKH